MTNLYRRTNRLLLPVVCAALLAACNGGETTYPRPYGFHRLELPDHEYRQFQSEHCPFTFEYPVYGEIEMERPDSCYFNISFPRFDCKWHATARFFDQENVDYGHTLEDFRDLVYKHTRKGNIYPEPVRTENTRGMLFNLYGQVGTFTEFYVSDSANYGLSVSCYFNTALKNDSLAPVIEFMKADVRRMIETMEWRAGRGQ